jgi:hypothetical protein
MMGFIFNEVSPYFINEYYKKYFHPNARYFEIIKNNKIICYYGIIKISKDICEAFWLIGTFNGKVFSKQFFIELFTHLFSIGYSETYTWISNKHNKLIRLFEGFKKFGIEKTECPFWDNDKTKIWFIRRI